MTASKPLYGIVAGASICLGGTLIYYVTYSDSSRAWLHGLRTVYLGVSVILVSFAWGVAGNVVSVLRRNHLLEPVLRFGNAMRRVLLLCAGLASAWWVYALVQGYNHLESVFRSPPGEEYTNFYPALVLPTAIAAVLAVCQSIVWQRASILMALGFGCAMASGLAIYNFRYAHDLSHTIFQECSGKAGDVHEQVMTSNILLSLLSAGIVIYRKQAGEQAAPSNGDKPSN